MRGELTRDTGGSEGAVAIDNTILERGVVRTTTRKHCENRTHNDDNDGTRRAVTVDTATLSDERQ